MIAFIDAHRDGLGVEPICKVLPIAPSTYHEHAARRADPNRLPPRARCDARLQAEIRRVWEENFQVYGVRKVWRQLCREEIEIARCTVERLMGGMGVQGAIRGKRVKTIVSDKATPCPLDKLNRKRSSTALLPLGRTDVLGRPGSGVFELSLWMTLPTTRRVSSGGSSC